MPIDIRTYLDHLLSSYSITKESADCIYQEYIRLKDSYLAGKLHKSALEELDKMRLEEQESRIRQDASVILPSVEDMALFTMAKNICDKAKKKS